MRKHALWRVSILTAPEAEEPVTELLSTTFNQAASAFAELETGITTISVFLEAAPAGFAAARRRLAAGLGHIAECGFKIAPGRIALKKLRPEDWAESWKKHFPPFAVGSRLLIKPSWSRRKARRGQAVVLLDPGLSFGTGRHPTTRFCLERLVDRTSAESRLSFLDVGTGSGILAIAAAKLGFRSVHAFDLDPEAVRVARANARMNGVSGRIKLFRGDITNLEPHPARRFSIICANLISTLLLQERERLVNRLAAGGLLVLAGILKTEFAEVQKAYESSGLRLARSHAEKEWRSGAFEERP